MELKKIILLGVLLITFIVMSLVFFLSDGEEEIIPSQKPAVIDLEQQQSGQNETEKVTLFFLSEEDGLLHPEEREIIVSPSLDMKARTIIAELIRGSQKNLISPFPPETVLREFFLSAEGVAYVDFSKDFQDDHPSGASAEIATVYSVVNTLIFNLDKIKKVFILIDGGEKETLSGHIDLSRPFVPKFDLIVE
ncbi:MAG: GerMN domain-containing protein [Candidatus Aminicenantes bacterium]|nr:GerMN domain-containing protein [Candidatus Aminicenantes bacterium]